MNILITGSKGFIGKNLLFYFKSQGIKVLTFDRGDELKRLESNINKVSFIFHLAGINRPNKVQEFIQNINLTKKICKIAEKSIKKIPIVFASSIQVNQKNPYGDSKLEAEKIIVEYSKKKEVSIYLYRLPNIFGKWSKPNYNSFIATICFNLINNLPISIHDNKKMMELVYIDDLVNSFFKVFKGYKDKKISKIKYVKVSPSYKVSCISLFNKLKDIHDTFETISVKKYANGFGRALYSTYLSFLPDKKLIFTLLENVDDRGSFTEFIRTIDNGQISIFKSNPGISRGNHYHNSKNEKFLVVNGKAKFEMINLKSRKKIEIFLDGKKPQVLITPPGWAHKITNVSKNMLIAVVWANENFNINNPDTYEFNL